MKKRLQNFISNILVAILNIFIKRDYQIVLFGCWFGERFSDNSRYLFQYLTENKEQANVKKVIWVTRSDNIYKTMESMNYKVYKLYSIPSIYYHLKSGVHIICNQYKTEILSNLSFGAYRVQLWHGVALKACASQTNENKNKKQMKTIDFRENKIKLLLKETKFYNKYYINCWDKYYFLTTGKLNTEINKKDFNIKDEYIIESNYPRNCRCIRYTEYEKEIVSLIKRFKKVIIYVPTFRSDYSEYIHPLESKSIVGQIKNSDWLWIEKPHGSRTAEYNSKIDMKNILYLQPEFDINTVLEFANLIISDYSSIVFDGMYRNCKILYYIPDFQYYMNEDRGFIVDYDKLTPGVKTKNLNELLIRMKNEVESESNEIEMVKRYNEVNSHIWENSNKGYKEIWNDIRSALKA